MIDPQKREAVFLLHQEGMGVREISRRLRLSRNTVRRIIKQQGRLEVKERRDKIRIDPDLLADLHEKCCGYAQRVHEILVEEKKIEISYSTLTRLLRQQGLREAHQARCDRVPDEPGAEMQHDTTPYRIEIAGTKVRLVASMLYLRYSKRRYLRFYPRFDRFRMKCFLHEALTFWGYAAKECIIDNTNLARLRGTGKDAVMVPEMAAFLEQYGSRFVCHERGHANRKAGEERSFWTVETNFFPGRTFESWTDLNAQAFEWATARLFHRAHAKTGLIPAQAFEHERPYLIELPQHLPAPYRPHTRVTDQYGYAAFDGNYYWVPGTDRGDVDLLEYAEALEIYRRRELLIRYPLPAQGTRNERLAPEGQPRPRYGPARLRRPTAEEEKRLRAIGPEVAAYLDFARPAVGLARHRFVRRLFGLSQQMSPDLFVRAIQRALTYRVRDLDTVRRIALLHLSEGLDVLPHAEVDQDLERRESYREGHLTDAPDFSAFDEMFAEPEEGEEEGHG